MADFLAGLLGALFGGLVPERAIDLVVAIVMLIAGLAFVALAGFTAYRGVASHAVLFTVMGSFVFLGLAVVCFRLMIKGFRSASRLRGRTNTDA